jgi:hypothetical protein
MPHSEPNAARQTPNRGMLSWGPWLLFAIGILMLLGAPMYDHQVIQDAVRGRREVPLVAGEVLVVCGSLLMIAGAALPHLGRSTGERLRSSEAERTLEGLPVARSWAERSGVGGR